MRPSKDRHKNGQNTDPFSASYSIHTSELKRKTFDFWFIST